MKFAISLILGLLVTGYSTGVSYNKPKLSLCASWNLNATTFADDGLVGKEPTGMFIDTQNAIYVSDLETNRVLIWYNESSFATRILSGNLTKPWSIFVTTDGNVYVYNGLFNDQIDKWSSNATDGELVLNVGGTCTGLFIDSQDFIYCSLVNHHRVVKAKVDNDSVTSIIVAGTGCPGPISHMLNHPHGILVDSNFNLYVADTFNDRIQRFALDQLDAITVIGLEASTPFRLRRPTGIVLDDDNCMFVVDSNNHRIIRSLPDGYQCLVGCSGNSGATMSHLYKPQTMAFDSHGNIFVTDPNNHRVQKFVLAENVCVCSPACVNGECIYPKICQCYSGWQGSTCSSYYCEQGCGNGRCIGANNCQCNPGWQGATCTSYYCEQGCGNGRCVDANDCQCYSGWQGSTCSSYYCEQGCGNGRCIGANNCQCNPGWQGATCTSYHCMLGCENGICIGANTCQCNYGWAGPACTTCK